MSGDCFWASDPLIDGFYKNVSIKWSEAQKQRSDELLWMLWFDEKSISKVSSILFIWDLRPLVCACLFMPWSWRGKLIALQSFLSLSREWHTHRLISSRRRWLLHYIFFLDEIEFVVALLWHFDTVWSERFLYKVAPLELKISPIMYFVIHNSVVLSKILKIVVPFWLLFVYVDYYQNNQFYSQKSNFQYFALMA